MSKFEQTLSKIFSNLLPSPSALVIKNFLALDEKVPEETLKALRPLSSSVFKALSFKFFKMRTWVLERSAQFISNPGFSVVAPINTNKPDSMCGRKASC